MREEIIANLHNPHRLELLYRNDKPLFKKEFNLIYQEINANAAAQVWHERLNYEKEDLDWGTAAERIMVVALSFLAGLVAKIPAFTSLSEDFFYQRNISFILFPFLIVYFSWKLKTPVRKILLVLAVLLIAAAFINFLPDAKDSDTVILTCIHLPLFGWALLGIVFTGDKFHDYQKRLEFLRYNGDLAVMTAIILIAGGMLSAVTIGLFELIDIKIEKFYTQYIVVWGLAAAPVVGTYLVQTNPQLVNKVSPVVARVFTPLVLIMLVIYLIAVIGTGKDPYNDREFLFIFNLLLAGVMAIILFSIAGISKISGSSAGIFLLAALSVVTILVNGVALSAILFRIFEYGITPNRLAVSVGNILILSNLSVIAFRLYRSVKNKTNLQSAEQSIAGFLPVYVLWTMVVAFIFPLVFGFK